MFLSLDSGVASRPGRTNGEIARSAAPVWLPSGLLFLVVLMISAQWQYAASGGAEIQQGDLVGSSPTRQAAFLVLGAMGAYLLMRHPTLAQRPYWPVLATAALLLGYLHVSAFWSDAPWTTFKRSVVMTCVVVAGLGLGRTWTFRQFAVVILLLSSTFLAVSILAELHYRAFLSTDQYRFSGIFHPAKQAFNCGMLALASLSLFFNSRRKRFLAITSIALAFLILTKARTGFVATLAAGLVLAWPYLSMKTIAATGLAGLWISAGLVVYSGATGQAIKPAELATMGRDEELADPTQLTGRWPIWNHALDQFQAQPILGFGYGAFWTRRRLDDFQRRNGWALAHAHSGYVESLVNLGIAGSALAMSLTVLALVRSVPLAARACSAPTRFVTALLSLSLVSSFAEVAFVVASYECLAVMIGIGLLAFERGSENPTPGAAVAFGDRLSPGRFRLAGMEARG